MRDEYRQPLLNRLKTVRGHLDGTIRMVEDDTYCIDVMKQLSALQASIERANRLLLQNHLETCFAAAIAGGDGEAAVSELIDALKFSPALTGAEFAAGLAEGRRANDRLAAPQDKRGVQDGSVHTYFEGSSSPPSS